MRHGRISWKRGATLALLLMLVVPILAACGGGAAPAAAPTAAPAAAEATAGPAAAATAAPAAAEATAAPAAAEATAAPAAPAAGGSGRGAGGTLRILYWQAPTILNTHLSSGTKDSDASRLILEPLAATGVDGKPIAVLASEVPTVENGGVSKDLKTVTWKLKSGVKWSDGSDFTADDVVFTYTYCADEKTACTDSAAFAGADKVEAVDPQTVKITWKEANPNPYQMFVSVTGGHILQKKQFGDCIGEKASTDSACQAANNAPIGTGPYKLREFKSGDQISYDINDTYRDADKPFFKEVLFKGGGDATSAARAVFQTGDTDYAWNLQVEAPVLKQLQEGGQGEFITIAGSSVERILLNRTNPDPALGDKRSEISEPHPFLSDLKVRQALGMAIDRKAVAALYPPGAGPTCEIITTQPFIDPAQIYGGRHKCEPDIEGAKKLLDEAGWVPGSDGIRAKGGVQMKIIYATTVNPLRQKEQALVKAAWDQLGISTELKSTDAGVFFASDAGNPDTVSHLFTDVAMYTNNYSEPNPTNYLCGWATDQIAAKANSWQLANTERFSNKDYDALCQQLRTETDEAKRKDIVLKMNDIVVEDVVNIPLVARPQVASGINKNLKGVQPNPWDSEMWNIADWTMSQ